MHNLQDGKKLGKRQKF